MFKFLSNNKIALFILLVGLIDMFTYQLIVGTMLVSCSIPLFEINEEEDEVKPKERDVIPTDSEGEE